MIPRELLKGDLHLLDLAGVGFDGADSFTTVTSSSTSVKGNRLESHAALLAVSRIIGDLVMVDSPPSLKELAETSAALRAPGYQVVQAHRA